MNIGLGERFFNESRMLLAVAAFAIAPWALAADPETDPELANYQKLKAQYDAQKAMYEAQTQMHAAELAAAKAKYGDVESPYKGEVTAEANAANAEAQLLSNLAVNKLASGFADALVSSPALRWGSTPAQVNTAPLAPVPGATPAAPAPVGPAGAAAVNAASPAAPNPWDALPAAPSSTSGGATPTKPWEQPGAAGTQAPLPASRAGSMRLVLTTTLPDFQAVLAFDARMLGLRKQRAAMPVYPGQKNEVETASVAAVGLALKGLDSILSFFRTDFTFKSVSATANESEWITALSGALSDRGVVVLIPGYDPKAASEDAETQIAELQNWLKAGRLASNAYDKAIKDRADEIEAITNKLKAAKGADKTKFEARLKVLNAEKVALEADKAQWMQFATAVVAWSIELTTATSDGKVPLVEVIRQRGYQRRLCAFPGSAAGTCGRLALTKLEHSVGNSYIKKNMWSSLGANPFYVMGGAVASLTVFGDTGEIIFAKTGAVHGKYLSVSDVAGVVNGEAQPAVQPGIPHNDS